MLLFILSWAIKQIIFVYWLYLLNNKTLFFGGLFCCKFWIFYSIYFIILISMITGNLVEIRLPKIQSRKCLRKFNSNEIRSPELSAYHLPQPKECFPSTMFEIFSSVLAYRIFDLLLVVVFFHYVVYCCQYHEPLLNIKKQTGHWLGPFLCLNCFTNTLLYYWKNYHFCKAQSWYLAIC